MTEPDVTLTDYLLTVECLACAGWLATTATERPDRRRWATAFFVTTGLAAVSGGTMHGFFNAPDSRVGLLLWRVSLLSIGAAAASGGLVAVGLLFRAPHTIRSASHAVSVVYGGYALVVVLVHDAFWMAIAGYLPAALFLLVAVHRHRAAGGPPRSGLIIWGLVITFLAAGGQQAGVGLPALSLGHNAVYHLIQAVGLLFIGAGFRVLLEASAPDPIDRVNGDEPHPT